MKKITYILLFISTGVFSQNANWSAYLPAHFPVNISSQTNGISRTTQFKFHPSNPNKMYAVSSWGGLFISTDGGTSWNNAPGTDNISESNSACVCIDYTNDNTLYLGTGDANYYSLTFNTITGYGSGGVWKSTNGGQTFTQVGLSGRIVVEIIMDPTNHSTLVAATDGGIYKSTDGGSTWNLKSSAVALRDLKELTATSRVLLSCGTSTLIRSSDFGDSWSTISGVVGGVIAVTNADTTLVAVCRNGGTLYKSHDGGQTFPTSLNPGTTTSSWGNQGDYNFAFAIDGQDASKYYMSYLDTYTSVDSGATWTMVATWWGSLHADHHKIMKNPYNNTQLWDSNDGGLFMSTDEGQTWNEKSDGLYGYECYHGSCSPVRKDLMFVQLQDNGMAYADSTGWYTNEGGDAGARCSWDYNMVNPWTYFYYANNWLSGQGYPYDATGDRKLYTTGEGVFHTDNLPSSPLRDIAFNRSNPNLGFAGISDVYISTTLNNTNPTWTQISSFNTHIMAIHSSFADPNRLYVITNDGKMHISTNALGNSPTFSTVTLPNTTNNAASITSITSDANSIYITCNTKAYYSNDNGNSWTDITYNLPSVNHVRILADEYYSSNQLVFVASFNTLYYKYLNQNTWTIYSNQLPLRTTITDLSIYNDTTNKARLRLTLYGRGIWESSFANLRPVTSAFAANRTNPCPGAAVNFTDNSLGNITSWSWVFQNGNPSTSNQQNPTVSFASVGTDTITLTVSDGVTNSTSKQVITVSVHAVNPIITGVATICSGGTTTFDAGSYSSYIWNTGATTETILIGTAGTYTVTVTDNSGCTGSASRTLTVNTAPATPGPIGGNNSVCQGSTQIYTIASVIGATSYTWILPSGWTGTSTSTNITTTVGTLSGTVKVHANNICGSSTDRTLSVTVLTSAPSQPGTISGNISVCQGSSQTYSITAVSGATSYTWTLPSGWTGTSSTTSITTTVGSSGGNITVTANNACGISTASTLTITLNTVPAQPGAISGNTTVCQGSSQNYSITAVTGATSYLWTLPSGWAGTSTTTSISTTAGSIGGSITVRASNACGNSTSQTLVVSVTPIPSLPGTITGNTSICAGSSQTYSIASVSGATSYNWTLPSGWSGTSTTTSINTTAGSSGGNISVTASNACGTGSARILAVSIIPVPSQPGSISGNNTVCSGSSQTYSITSVSGATSYTWTLPGGWTGSSTTTSITTTAGSVGGNITVTANNACGSSTAQIIAITVISIPSLPGSISGSTTICSGSTQTYSISSVTGATSYTWTLPNGWSGSSTATSITVTVGATGGTISVNASNACGSSTNQTLTITVNQAPAQPGTISGNTSVCQGNTETYSITTVSGATSYTWTLPNGWSGTSTATSIAATTGSTGGNITVTASNDCGTSSAQVLVVSIANGPNQPGAISGNTSVCSGSTQTYSIASVSGATSYTWTLPSGWSGSSTTTSITVTSGSVGGTISVTANNLCGSSIAQTLVVAIAPVPTQPGIISGVAAICQNTSNTYSITAVSGATSYTWTLPNGWTGSSTTTSITAIAGTTGGNISVNANNDCGGSTPSTLSVAISNGVPSQPGVINGNTPVCRLSSQTYSVAAVNGATSYTWTLPAGWTGTSATNSITVTVGNASGNITVKANNPCGSSSVRVFAVIANNVPNQPGVISGSTPVCAGSIQTYSIASVAGATSYTWTLPSGWSGSSTTTSITVTIGTAGGNLMVNADNACGNSSNRVLFVAITPLPPTPGTITGATTVCSGSSQTYSIASVAGATSYIWTLPSGWSGSSTTTSISCTAGITGGNVSVLAVNNCGVSNTTRTLAVSVLTTPAQPGAISGSTSVCSGATSLNYHITAVAGATSYTWTLPSGWSGTSTTTTILANAGTTGGTISVTASNSCGTSIAQTLAVTVNTIPVQPGTISGSTAPCQAVSQTYSVSPVAGATSYTWTLPTGWTGTSTLSSITCVPNGTSGNITVKAVNSCGSSPVQTLAVNVIPVTAVTITANPANFNYCAQISPNYLRMFASSGYTSYAWSPSGGNTQTATISTVGTYTVSAINGAGCPTKATHVVTSNCALPTNLSTTNILGTSAKANWVQSQCAYNYTIQISVHGLNNWTQFTVSPSTNYTFTGLNLSTQYDWQIQANCNTSGSINSGWTLPQTFTTASSRMAEESISTVGIYPNPADGLVTISFSSMQEGSYSLSLVDMMGRTIITEVDNASIGNNAHIMNLDGIAKGVYLIILQKGNDTYKSKLVIE